MARRPPAPILGVFAVLITAPLVFAQSAPGRAAAAGTGAISEAASGTATAGGATVNPATFDGDVRTLPPVPNVPFSDFEPEAPVSTKSGGGTSGGPRPGAPAGASAPMPAPTRNFAGLKFTDSCGSTRCGGGWPPDPNGDVGPNNYIEAVNTAYAIYSKTGTLLAAFTENALWAGSGSNACNGSSQGDPIVLYDTLADRWVLTHFAFSSGPAAPFYQCLAVSKTGDPVAGGWWLYPLRIDGVAGVPAGTLNDYPKFGMWNDCLYFSANGFDATSARMPFNGAIFGSINREDMYNGLPLHWAMGFIGGGSAPFTMVPSNLRATVPGALPPPGTPNYFVNESGSVFGFEVRKFTPGPSCGGGGTLSAPTVLMQQSYPIPLSGPNFEPDFVDQPGTTNRLDSLFDRVMQKVQYRRVGSSESLWVVHTTASDAVADNAIAQPQWAQIDVSGGVIAPNLAQEQIFTNGGDSEHRWMASIAADNQGNVAMGYSRSSATPGDYPSIAYAGRLAGDAANQLPQTETVQQQGSGSQTNICGTTCHRWGDYSAMSVDPVDDCTFWYVNEYYASTTDGTSGNWSTRIGSFKFPSCTAPAQAGIRLGFSAQPPASGLGTGSPLLPLTVQVLDASNALVSSDNTTQVTITKLSGPGNLTCPAVTATAGVADFTNCTVDVGGNYVLKASATNLAPAYTGTFSVTGPPAAPTYDRATALSTTSLQLFWTDNATNESGYLAYRVNPGPSTLLGASPGGSPPNTTTVTDTGLLHNKVYAYQVYAWNPTGSVYPGTYFTGRTLGDAPAAPRAVAAWGSDTSSVTVTWIDNASNEDGFRIKRWNGSSFDLAGSVGPNVTSYTDTGLAPGSSHFYVIEAYNTDGTARSLRGVSGAALTSPAASTSPVPPSYLGPTTTATSVQLKWADNATDEQYYLVYRVAPGPSTLLATLPANTTTYTDTGLQPDTQYYYQVWAWNSSGSNYPGTYLVAATTPTTPTPPVTQSAAALSRTSMKVTWVDRSNNEDGFRIYRWTGSGNQLAGTVSSNITSFVDSGLTPSTNYVYIVTAYNTTGGESWAPDGIWAPTMP